MIPNVDSYFTDGCGRCPLGGTPACKVHNWQKELLKLRELMLDSGLEEELKWSMPTYTFGNKNVAMISAFKDYCAVSFFKGVLLRDEESILVKPGENTQAARIVKYSNEQQIDETKSILKSMIQEAIQLEKAGATVDFTAKSSLVYPEELLLMFNIDPELKTAFEALTPGRQRGYNLHFTQPKQSGTRTARIKKCRQRILDGKGLNERY